MQLALVLVSRELSSDRRSTFNTDNRGLSTYAAHRLSIQQVLDKAMRTRSYLRLDPLTTRSPLLVTDHQISDLVQDPLSGLLVCWMQRYNVCGSAIFVR